MAERTNQLNLVYVSQGQASITPYNETILLIEAVAGARVTDYKQNTPGTEVQGRAVIVGTSPTGDFAGESKNIAVWDGASYTFLPSPRATPFVREADNTWIQYNGSNWRNAGFAPVFVGERSSTASSISMPYKVQMNQQGNVAEVFTHSTSTNPETITLDEGGLYICHFSLWLTTSGTSGSLVLAITNNQNDQEFRWTLGDGDTTLSGSFAFEETTETGGTLELTISVASGSGTVNVNADGVSIIAVKQQ